MDYRVKPASTITALASQYAAKGMSLRSMAKLELLDYAKLKSVLKEYGYSHPRNTDLLSNRLKYETGLDLGEYLVQHIAKGLSRNEISRLSGIDNKTLQTFADNNKITIPRSKPIPRNLDNIIAANRSRCQKSRLDLVWLEFGGKKQHLANWSNELGIPRGTIKSRLELGYPIYEALSQTRRKHRGFSAFNKSVLTEVEIDSVLLTG